MNPAEHAKTPLKLRFSSPRTKLVGRRGRHQIMSLKQLSMRFEERIRDRNRIWIRPPNRLEWFRGAYSTIQRVLRNGFVPLNDDQKEICSQFLWAELPRLHPANFDAGARDIMENIRTDYGLSIGHAQKLISIFCKYAFVVYHIDTTALTKDWREFIQSTQRQLLVPLDSEVLFALAGQLENVEVRSRTQRTVWVIQPGGKRVPWSRIDDSACFWSLQQHIRVISAPAIPLEFEMRNLWPA